MKELNLREQHMVSGGDIDVSDMFAAGVGGAIAGGTFGASTGALVGAGVGSVPAAAVLGGLGAGVGFVSGLVTYAFNQ